MESRKKILTSIVLFALLISFFYFTNAIGSSADQLEVSFINVGQGDSALISDASGFDILIDGGKTSAGPTVVAYLKSKPIDDIDVMIASHADSDHVGGLIDVLESDIPVEAVYYNGYPGDTTTWSDFATAVANKGLTLTAAQFPQEYTWGSVTAYILNPATGLTDPETNDASVVILFDKQENEFLFTGDMDSTIEATVVARGTPMAAEVLKVGHHGSKYSSSADFLNAVQPKEAVISVGNNSYGHPADDTLLRLSTVGSRIWRTDEDGTVKVDSDGFTWQVIPEFITTVIRNLYLPLVFKPQPPTPTPSPTPTNTPLPTAEATNTPTATLTPTPTNTQIPADSPTPTNTQTPSPTPTETQVPEPSTTGNIDITNIFYDGAGSAEPDEYVEIKNNDTNSIQVQNWTLSDAANHIFTFPNFVMSSGQTCRVYTNQNHPEWCGFNYGSGSAIWNNGGDTATLRDGNGTLIDTYTY